MLGPWRVRTSSAGLVRGLRGCGGFATARGNSDMGRRAGVCFSLSDESRAFSGRLWCLGYHLSNGVFGLPPTKRFDIIMHQALSTRAQMRRVGVGAGARLQAAERSRRPVRPEPHAQRARAGISSA